MHKKYTYKNGKRYGPYLYETKRVNGQVITTYLGRSEEKENGFRFLYIILAVLIILGVGFTFYSEKNITAKVSLGSIEVFENGTLERIEESTFIEEGEIVNAEEGSRIEIKEVQYGAVLGKPVKWRKNIKLFNSPDYNLTVPDIAENVSVVNVIKKVEEEILEEQVTEESIEEPTEEIQTNETEEQEVEENIGEIIINETEESIEEPTEEIQTNETEEQEVDLALENSSISGAVSLELDIKEKNEFIEWLKNVFKFTGFVVDEKEEIILEVEKNVEEVEIEYYTPAPYALEEDLERGKLVKIVGPDDVHYESVLAFTELPGDLPIKNKEKVKIFWKEEGKYVDVENVVDLDEDGIYDYVEWIVPHLSEQTFEIIIVITGAEHLDSNKEFISDIYEEVKEKDDLWSETIGEGEYVRITFEKKLTSSNDITIFPKIVSGNPRIEVYEMEEDYLITEFTNLIENEFNKVYLEGLLGEQDSFDLKILGGSLEFDLIIDPVTVDDTEDSFTGSGNCFNVGVAHANLHDEDWSTYVQCGGSDSPGSFFINYTIPSGVTSVDWEYKVQSMRGRRGNSQIIGYCYDNSAGAYTSALWTCNSNSLCQANYTLPSDCVGSAGEDLGVKMYLQGGIGLSALGYEEQIWWTATAGDTLVPNVTINFPASSGSYETSDLPLNFNVSLSENGSVMYSLDSGTNNITMYHGANVIGSEFNITNLGTLLADDTHTFNVYANDTSGNNNYTESVSFTFENTNVDSCRTLDKAGTVYTLTDDVTTTGDCFTISADNITLEGAGKTVDGDDSSGDEGVIVSGKLNVTIRNLIITDFGKGIYFTAGTNNSLIKNNNISSGQDGIYIDGNSKDNEIVDNNSSLNSLSGIYLFSVSTGNLITNNTLTSNSLYGLLIRSTSHTNVTGNIANLNSEAGILIRTGVDNNIINNIANSNKKGLYFTHVSTENNIVNLSINGSTGDAIYFGNAGDDNNNFTNVSITHTNSSHFAINFAFAGIDGSYFIDDYFIENYSFAGLGGKVNFKNSTSGIVNFLSAINGSGTNFTNDVRISYNSLVVESGNNFELNKTANITLLNKPGFGIADPEIKRDGKSCNGCFNFTALSDSTVIFNVTGFSEYKIGEKNTAPITPTPGINSTDGTNKTDEDLHCFDTLVDPDGDYINVTVWWFNESAGSQVEHIAIDYNYSYANNTFFNATLSFGNTTKHMNWTCGMRLFDGVDYSAQGNTTLGVNITNTIPSAPTLSSPAHASSTTDRTPTLGWNANLDADGDSLTFELNVTLMASSSCVDPSRHITSVSGTSHELSSNLLCFYDNLDYYNWSARTYDGEEYSSWTSFRSINISSEVSISLPNSTVEFLTISQFGTNDTSDNSPSPFLLQNDGNSFINVTIEASNLWNTVNNPTSNYQFKVDNYTFENYSFNWALSNTSYGNLPVSGSPTLAICLLNNTNATDTVEIDLNITLPVDEGSAIRNSTVTFSATFAE